MFLTGCITGSRKFRFLKSSPILLAYIALLGLIYWSVDLANLTRCKQATLEWAQRQRVAKDRNLSVA